MLFGIRTINRMNAFAVSVASANLNSLPSKLETKLPNVSMPHAPLPPRSRDDRKWNDGRERHSMPRALVTYLLQICPSKPSRHTVPIGKPKAHVYTLSGQEILTKD
jgi:hypothetical protein